MLPFVYTPFMVD